MSGKRSRNKGARNERAIVGILKVCFPGARRGRQYDSARECDVEGTPLRVEVKAKESIHYKFLEDAVKKNQEDGEDHNDNRPPIVIHKRDRGPWLFTGALEDLVRIVETLFYKWDEEDEAEVKRIFDDR